jgi:hypothetical protein
MSGFVGTLCSVHPQPPPACQGVEVGAIDWDFWVPQAGDLIVSKDGDFFVYPSVLQCPAVIDVIPDSCFQALKQRPEFPYILYVLKSQHCIDKLCASRNSEYRVN